MISGSGSLAGCPLMLKGKMWRDNEHSTQKRDRFEHHIRISSAEYRHLWDEIKDVMFWLKIL